VKIRSGTVQPYITINVPIVYMARYEEILMRETSITRGARRGEP